MGVLQECLKKCLADVNTLCFTGLCHPSIPGLIPIVLHVDGAEFYANSEYVVFSMGSILCEGVHPWDCKFAIACIPYSNMYENDIRKGVHKAIAETVAWSFKSAASGIFPSRGPWGDELTGARKQWAGTVVAGGWRAGYLGSRYDAKARKETNEFQRSYLHSFICEQCLAQKHHKGFDAHLSYKDFYTNAGHRMTQISTALSCTIQPLVKRFEITTQLVFPKVLFSWVGV